MTTLKGSSPSRIVVLVPGPDGTEAVLWSHKIKMVGSSIRRSAGTAQHACTWRGEGGGGEVKGKESVRLITREVRVRSGMILYL